MALPAEEAIRALWALKCLNNLMDLCDEFDEDEPNIKKRKFYVTSEDVECQLLKDIAWKNVNSPDEFCPLNMEMFEELYNKISARVSKKSLIVSLRMRLAITLRYLIAGESYRTLEKTSYVSRKSIQKIVPEMLMHLTNILENEHLKLPKTQSEWINEVNDFDTFWDFPHTLGVLDFRKFSIKSSETSGKSIILLSVLDAHSRFKHIEVIESEKHNYYSAYINSKLYKYLTSEKLNIPCEKPLKGQTDKTPYFFVSNKVLGADRYTLSIYDKDSPLTTLQKTFNLRLNRVRLPVEMAFEIVFFRFKIFYKFNEIDKEKAKSIIKTCCLLHNFLTQKLTQPLDYNEELTKIKLRASDTSLPRHINKRYEIKSKTRDNVCKYCVSNGRISEQLL